MSRFYHGLTIALLALGLAVSCSGDNPADENNRDMGEIPKARGGAPGVWIPGQNSMLIFGGMSPITNDTWQFSADQQSWEEIIDLGNIPLPRCHHTLVANDAGSDILLFGGFSQSGRFNDTWRFDAGSGTWSELNVEGPLPDKRCLQTSAYIESTGQMFVYGGISGGGVSTGDFFQDTWLFDSETQQWTQVETDSGPGKLSGAISFYSSEREAVFLWGGKQVDSYPTQLWRFDVESRSWTTVETAGPTPQGREDPTVFWNDDLQLLYMTHGSNENIGDDHPDGAFELDLETFTWTRLEGQEVPPQRWRASAVFDEATGTGYMYGGWVGFNDQNLQDTWKYDFDEKEWTRAIPR